ncbi:MAG: hypothetical protein ACKO4A_14320 [Gammaproteobacteria bacterium]
MLVALLALSPFSHAGSECWEQLEFRAGNRLASASSTVEYQRVQADSPAGRLDNPGGKSFLQPRSNTVGLVRTRFEAMRSHGQLDTWFDPSTGAALQARRLGFGRDSRLKSWRFLAGGVWRERRAPPEGSPAGSDPSHWELRSAGLVDYPVSPRGSAVITPIMLIAEAAALARQDAPAKATRWVFTDTQLYRVVLQSRPDESLDLSFTLSRGKAQSALAGERSVRRVDIRPHLQGGEPEEEPFTLLELDGEIAVFVDRETGLPLRIQGTWMRVGVVPVDLASARLAAGCGT